MPRVHVRLIFGGQTGGMWHWLQDLPQQVLGLDPVWLIVVCALLVFAEDAIFVGFVVPGETAAVIAGVATAIHGVPLWIAIVTIVVAAIVGDTVGYELGKHYFSRVLTTKPLQRHEAGIEKASDFLRRKGGIAVFLGRFTAFFRAMMPALAGSAKMPYLRFLKWNAIGGIVWGTTFVVVGHVAGRTYKQLEHTVGRDGAIAAAVLVVLALITWRVIVARRERHEERERVDDQRRRPSGPRSRLRSSTDNPK